MIKELTIPFCSSQFMMEVTGFKSTVSKNLDFVDDFALFLAAPYYVSDVQLQTYSSVCYGQKLVFYRYLMNKLPVVATVVMVRFRLTASFIILSKYKRLIINL